MNYEILFDPGVLAVLLILGFATCAGIFAAAITNSRYDPEDAYDPGPIDNENSDTKDFQ